MPIWGWVCLGVILIPIVLIGWAIVDTYLQERRCRRDGKKVIGWIVQANPELYGMGNLDRPAQILVAFNGSPDPPDPFMEKLAERAAALKREEQTTRAVEAEVAAMVIDETYRPFQRFLLPAEFTSGRLVYSMHVWVKRKYLPAGKLKNTYVRCFVIEDDEKSRPLMTNYEPIDREFRKRSVDLIEY